MEKEEGMEGEATSEGAAEEADEPGTQQEDDEVRGVPLRDCVKICRCWC